MSNHRFAAVFAAPLLVAAACTTSPEVAARAQIEQETGGGVVVADRATLTGCPPVAQTLQVHTGRPVEFPLCYDQSRLFTVSGTAALAGVTRELAGTGFYPVSINGRAIVEFYFFDFGRSSIGSYQGLDLGVLVSDRPGVAGGDELLNQLFSALNQHQPPTDYGIYFINSHASTRLAVDVGNDLLGTDKRLTRFGFTFADDSLQVTMDDSQRRLVSLQVKLPDQQLPEEIGHNTDLFGLFIVNGRRQWSPLTTQGHYAFVRAWSDTDRLWLAPHSRLSRFVDRVGFTPATVIHVPHRNAQLAYGAPR